MKRMLFILGGNDLEMVVIKQLLSMAGVKFVQPKKEWGDHSYSVRDLNLEVEPSYTVGNGFGGGMMPSKITGFDRVCFVECRPADDFPPSNSRGTEVEIVDHHGEQSWRPASILQVLRLLGLKLSSPTLRWVELVAANDSAWFEGMKTLGATADEMRFIRAGDRSAQEITGEQETEAERALTAPVEMVGAVRVIRMAHSKTGPVGDRLAIDAISAGKPIPAYLVFSVDGEVNFSGPGDLAQAIHEKFVGGWAGGSGLGKADGTAYWGGYPPHEEVLAFLRERLA